MRLKIYAKVRFGHFVCVLVLSSVICEPIHLFNASFGFQKYLSKKFNQKIYLDKNIAVAVVYFCYGQAYQTLIMSYQTLIENLVDNFSQKCF